MRTVAKSWVRRMESGKAGTAQNVRCRQWTDWSWARRIKSKEREQRRCPRNGAQRTEKNERHNRESVFCVRRIDRNEERTQGMKDEVWRKELAIAHGVDGGEWRT